jgi:hypothetical protein
VTCSVEYPFAYGIISPDKVNNQNGAATMSVYPVKRQVYQALSELPPGGFDELVQFLDYLKYKYKTGQKVVALKGLWADIPLDVTDQNIRHLRRQVSDQLLRKM